jgi:elongation factor Tu
LNSDIFGRSNVKFNIAMLGHSGHGKTTLTAAITKVLSKSNPRVQFRPVDSIVNAPGISGSVTHVEYEANDREYDLADCPSRGSCIADMMIAPGQLDGAIVVVAATDGPMPQTRDHLQLARRSNVPHIVVFMNKCDVVEDSELLDMIELEVRDLVTKCQFPGDEIPVIRGSALNALQGGANWEKPITDLMDALDASLAQPS